MASAIALAKRAGSVQVTAVHVIAGVVFVGVVRSLLEPFVAAGGFSVSWYAVGVLHQIAFYGCMYFLFLSAFGALLPALVQNLRALVLWGVIVAGLMPLVIDALLPFGLEKYNYFTELTPLFFSSQHPIGEGVVVWGVILGLTWLCWHKTRSFPFAIVGGLLAYALAQAMGWGTVLVGVHFLGLIAPALGIGDHYGVTGEITSYGSLLALQTCLVLVLLSMAFIAYTLHRFSAFSLVLKKLPYALVWGALVLVGAQLGAGIDAYVFLKSALLVFVFICLQIENDYYDQKDDLRAGRANSFTKDDLYIIRFFIAILSALFLLSDQAFGMILALSYGLGLCYSHEAFRLKKYIVTDFLIIVLGAFAAILAGLFVFSELAIDATIAIAFSIAALFGILSSVRDYKDVKGDRDAGVSTFYTVMTDRLGLSEKTVHLGILSLITLCTIATVALTAHAAPLSVPQGLFATFLLIFSFLPIYVLRKPTQSALFAITHLTLLILFGIFVAIPYLVI